MLELDRDDLKLFSVSLAALLLIYLITSNGFIVMNAIVSFIFTFVPARLERIRRTDKSSQSANNSPQQDPNSPFH